MARYGKKYIEARHKADRSIRYSLHDALQLVKDTASANFDESIEVAVRLGVNPQGVGKVPRVLVVAKG